MAETEKTAPIAVVSGGGTGIGRAIAAGLAADGFDVVILGRRPGVLEEAAAALNAEAPEGSGSGRISWRSVDLTDAEAVEQLGQDLGQQYGVIDAIVNNAGGVSAPADGSLTGLAQSWRSLYEQNVVSAVLLTHGLLPLLRRPGGRIVLVGSMSSRSGGGVPAYGAAKAALNGWVLSLSSQYAAEGISANVVLPGYVPGTELGGGQPMPEEIHRRIVSRIAAGRAGLPEDSAALVQFLVSESAGFLTGQVIEVNGGAVPSTK
jgi:3-oxoacyl-[acyl-carrier protein] reductase